MLNTISSIEDVRLYKRIATIIEFAFTNFVPWVFIIDCKYLLDCISIIKLKDKNGIGVCTLVCVDISIKKYEFVKCYN